MSQIKKSGTLTSKYKYRTGGMTSYRTEKIPGFQLAVLKPDPKKNKWQNIEDWIKETAKLDPEGFKDTMELVRETKKNYWWKRNKGMTKTKSMQHGVTLPIMLETAIKKHYPEVFTVKGILQKFMNKFPGFVVYK
ncbi:MAG: hypothetical protein ACOC5R_05625 [Elusimicrobiota bacterium]